MYLAEEITAKNHQFHHSRKKPKQTKDKASHRQGPLFAPITDMLHETDPAQKERAHHVCGSTTIYNTRGAARLFCGRRDCPVCFKRRYRKIAARIRVYVQHTSQKLYCKKIYSWERKNVVRDIKSKPKGEYVCLPVITEHGEEKEYIISNVVKGSPVHIDYPRLENNLSAWTKTPNGRKVSFSSGFRMKKHEGEKLPQFFGRIALSKIVPHAQAVGGTVLTISKSYVKWDVDTEKLTDRLVENDIVAYQLTMEKTLFEDARNAEDALVGPELVEPEFSAIPLDKKGKAVAPSVKLRQLLRELSGTSLHVTAQTVPFSSQKEVTATSPPPS